MSFTEGSCIDLPASEQDRFGAKLAFVRMFFMRMGIRGSTGVVIHSETQHIVSLAYASVYDHFGKA